MTEHTPGPWVQSGDYGLLKTEIVAPNALHRAIASVWTRRVNESGTTLVWPEGEANARLIATAPELLDACEAVVRWNDERDISGLVVYDLVTAAIAKARGEQR